MKILFLCNEGNSCRSLMAEAFLQEMNASIEVFSAGIHADEHPDPLAIEVMTEIGINISTKIPKSYHQFEGIQVDYLITICDGTKDKINSINIPAKHKIHLGFEDPKKANCTEEKKISIYREIRNEIKNEMDYFYSRILSNYHNFKN